MVSKKAAGMAAGTITGVALFFLTVLELIFQSGQSFEFFSVIHPGYGVSPLGALLGLIWGFIDGFILGFLFAALYNFFAPSQKDASS